MDAPELSVVLAQNGRFVRALARSLARDPERAEDLAQETWLRYVTRPPQATGSLRHWFRTVVRNLASSSARTEGRRVEREAEAARAEALPSAAEEYEHAELLRGVVEAVLGLEEPYRSTLLARYWRGWSAAKVAEETRTPLATVRSREQRALAELRGKLDRDWKGERGAWGLALARLIAMEPAAPAPPWPALAKLGLAAGVVLVGALTWRALGGAESAEPVLATPLVASLATAPPVAANAVVGSSTRTAAREELVTAAPSEGTPPGAQAFTAPAPSEVRARFVFSDGTPAAGVACSLRIGGTVEFLGSEPRVTEPPVWEDQSATSGPDGRVSFTLVKPEGYLVELEAELAGFATATWNWAELTPGQVLDLGDVPTRLAGVITGRVVRADGTPILGEGWSVTAQSIGARSPDGRFEAFVETATDPATGSFRLEGLMPGTNELVALSSMTGRVQAPNVALAEGGTAEVDIVYSGPEPSRRLLVDVRVELFWTVPNPLAEHVRLLGPGGPRTGLVFDDLEPGSYTLEIDDPRFALWRQEGLSPGTRVEARLVGNSAVVLTATDAATGSPVALDAAHVTLRNVNSFPNVFHLDDVAGGRIDGMVAGDSTIEVRSGDRVGSVEIDGLAIGETRSAAVVVAALPPVTGIARFTDGAPAVGFQASLLVPARQGDSNASDVLSLGGNSSDTSSYRVEIARTQVDGDGRFGFVAPRDGTYLVHVAGFDGTEAFSQVFALAAAPELELELVRPGALSGRIALPPGGSAAGLRVWALPVAIGRDRSSDLLERTSVALGEDGTFTIPSVAAGTTRVFLMLPRPLQWRGSGWVSFGTGWSAGSLMAARELGSVEIPPGDSLEHDFAIEDFPGTLELTVRVDGVPVPRLALTLKRSQSRERLVVGTDDRGIYQGPLFPGTYRLEVLDSVTGWKATAPDPIVIESARPTIVTVEFERP